MSQVSILGVSGICFYFYHIFDRNYMLANSVYPDQSDLGLHSLHTCRSHSLGRLAYMI